MAWLSRNWRYLVGGIVGLALLILLILAAFPWGVLRDRVSVKLAERFGSDVSIGTIERVEPLSFSPTLIVRDLRIAQPSWAGTGDLVHLDRIDFWPDALWRLDVEGDRGRFLRGRESFKSHVRSRNVSDFTSTTFAVAVQVRAAKVRCTSRRLCPLRDNLERSGRNSLS